MRDVQYDHVRTKLTELLNHKVSYGLSDFSIVDFKYDSEIKKFIIDVDDRNEPFEFTISDAVDFVREARVIGKPDNKEPKKTIIQQMKSAAIEENITNTIKSTVLECIEKIKSDASYIPQANAIANQIQTLVNIKKVEIDAKRNRLL